MKMAKTVFVCLCLFIFTVNVAQNFVSAETHVKKPDVSLSNITVESVKVEPAPQHEKRSKRNSPNGIQPDGKHFIEAAQTNGNSLFLTVGKLSSSNQVDLTGHAYLAKKTGDANQIWCTHLENKKDGIYSLRLVMPAKYKDNNNYTLTVDKSFKYLDAKIHKGDAIIDQQFQIETAFLPGLYTITPAGNKDLMLYWRIETNSVEFNKMDQMNNNNFWKIGKMKKETSWDI